METEFDKVFNYMQENNMLSIEAMVTEDRQIEVNIEYEDGRKVKETIPVNIGEETS